MKEVPFTITFVSKFANPDQIANVPDEVLTKMCKEGLVELIAPRMEEINKGATHIFVEVVK